MNKCSAIAAAIATLMLSAACGETDVDTQPNDNAEPKKAEPKKNVAYETVVDLRDAYVAAGYSCPDWEQTDVVAAALESGECDDATVLSIYPNREEAKEAAALLTGFSASLGDGPARALVGPNWVVNIGGDSDYEPLKADLGGTIETSY